MGWWTRNVVPRIVDKACSTKVEHEIRARVCAGLSGDVLELGFGSGLNLQHLPPDVTSLHAVDPSDVGYKLAAPRVAASPVPVRRGSLDDLADGSVDHVLSTWTMCTIPDVVESLREARRVLKPGGTLRFAEHGVSPDEGVARWQHRLNPLQRRIAGGCHLDRPIDVIVSEAGFRITALDRFYAAKTPKVFGYLYEGVAAAS